MENAELEYVGFWARLVASLIDTVLMGIIVWPLLHWWYGPAYWLDESLVHGPADFLLSWLLPALAVILFWVYRQATPGKMAVGATIVDADTGARPGTGQLLGRYLAYYVSLLPFCLGFLWVAFDRRKQGWHDKLAGTVVVRRKRRVEFKHAPAERADS
jgi:uncharacterized RDD family membrane protein YckC